MKKLLAASLASLALLLMTGRPVSAWSKWNFGVGLNLGWEGAGNSVLWGVYKGGPAPGQFDGGAPGGYGIPDGGGFQGAPGFDPSLIAPPIHEPAKTMPGGPEKVGPPTPVKPAAYFTNPYQPAGYYYYPYQATGYYPVYPGYYGR